MSAALASISEDIVFCSKLKASSERLACFDAAARLEKTAKTPKTASLRDPTVAISNGPRQSRTWSGFSVGLGASAIKTRSTSSGTLTAAPGGDPFVNTGETSSALFSSASGTGPAIDLRAGYSLQAWQSLVVGVQADLSIPALRVRQDLQVGPCDHPACVHTFDFPGRGQFTLNWMASALLKAGFAISADNLVYALGGASHAAFTSAIVTTIPLPNSSNSYLFTQQGFAADGWTVGLGWERRIADAWSIYSEYRLNRFASIRQQSSYALTGCVGFPVCYSNTQMSGFVDLQSLRLGISRSFATD
jgi:opacity protein-like surface antigen